MSKIIKVQQNEIAILIFNSFHVICNKVVFNSSMSSRVPFTNISRILLFKPVAITKLFNVMFLSFDQDFSMLSKSVKLASLSFVQSEIC